jgi:EAL and modified HD-GYP domain-containing signal transduction protein
MSIDRRARVYLGRQRVVDADRAVFGYELLHRSGPDRTTTFDDPDGATRGVMERVLLQWGMERVVGDRFGLINASASLVVRGLHLAMPPEGVIIEMREPSPFDRETVAALHHARLEGYHFALDNVGRLADLEHSTLLPMASIVKIELTTAHDAELPRLIEVARKRSPGVLVVAEKVETLADFERCVEHGFDLFQGFFFSRPEVLDRPSRPANRRAAAALQSLVGSSGPIDVVGVEETIAADPSLTFRVLAAVDANAFGLDSSVGSIAQAIGVLGARKLRCLAELTASSAETIGDEPELTTGAIRARMVERLLDDPTQAGRGTTAALLSATDRVYGAPIGDLLDELPVSPEITAAILHGQGPVGVALDIARACEQDDVTTLRALAPGRCDELLDLHATIVTRYTTRPNEFADGAD